MHLFAMEVKRAAILKLARIVPKKRLTILMPSSHRVTYASKFNTIRKSMSWKGNLGFKNIKLSLNYLNARFFFIHFRYDARAIFTPFFFLLSNTNNFFILDSFFMILVLYVSICCALNVYIYNLGTVCWAAFRNKSPPKVNDQCKPNFNYLLI